MSLRKIAGVLVGLGLVVGMMGAGIGASFVDSASATANIAVGTFGLSITSTTAGAVVVNTGTAGNSSVHTVTYDCPTILSSKPGSCPLQLTLTNTGTIPMTVAVAWNTVPVPFQAIPMLNSYSLAGGESKPIPQAGIMWGQQLTDANLGQTISITYTFTATQ